MAKDREISKLAGEQLKLIRRFCPAFIPGAAFRLACVAAIAPLPILFFSARAETGQDPSSSAPPIRLAQTEDAGSGRSIKSLDGKTIDIDEARRLFEQHQKELEKVEKERQGLESETETLNDETASLQTRLIEAGQKVQAAEKQLTRSEGEIDELTKQEVRIRIALKESRANIAQMLAVMQRMGREPPPVMMTERNDALRMVRSAMILSSFFPGFKAKADELARTLTDLNTIITKSKEEHVRLASAQTDFTRLKSEIDALLAEKSVKVKRNQERMEALKLASTRHSRAVTNLGDLLQRMDAEVAKNSTLAAYEQELKQLGPAIELKPSVTKTAFVSPGRMKPAVPFEKAKGSLPFPAQGKRVKSFGVKDDGGSKSEGIYVETRSEAQITSPSDGWVIYAGQFRSYGQILIINAGGGYHILLAGLDQIYTNVGQFVLAGEPVASMGKNLQLGEGGVQTRNPVLYIEFRKDARPFDPDPGGPRA
ncbi:MAG: peptidoglycan DD-metalloendopeptidase family protein [Rhodomicrobium sp.]|nr:peptidoglycan DD-metalloendopeptidase family protein [Rhodomicrobium sp.]